MTGSGTELDPYIIEDVTDLQNVNNDLTAWYELGNNINAMATASWNGGAGFLPIGGVSGAFSGHFDGKNYSIFGLFIYRPSTNLIALFRNVSGTGTTVDNVRLYAPHITGQNYVGGMFGTTTKNVTCCCVEGGVIKGRNYVGGFIGIGVGAHRCWTTGVHIYTNEALYPDVRHIGGFGGAGGRPDMLNNCYARNTLHFYARTRVGGLFPKLDTVHKNYSACTWSLIGSPDGFYPYGCGLGRDDGSNSGNFFDNSIWASGLTAYGACEITAKTTTQMKTQSTFTDAGWDFSTIWAIDPDINNGYPYLRCNIPGEGLAGYIWASDEAGETTELHYMAEHSGERAIEGTVTGDTGDAGHLWVEGTYLHYIDSLGDERRSEGTLDGAAGQTAGAIWIEGDMLRYIDGSGNERYLEGSVVE